MEVRLTFVLFGWMGILFANNVSAAVGRTAGQFAVSPTGDAQYTIPIWSPPGVRGVQPHLALVYNSQQGNGYVGVGWGVSGLSSIYRCNRTIAQDGAAAPVALATSDGYCMDGNRLRLTGGTYGTASSTYQTEIANFVNVKAYGAAGNGPAYWQATDRNGWHYTYGGGGTTSNAEVLASGSSSAVSWQLSTVTDPSGNSMTITYSTSNVTGVVVPNVISWVPASLGSSSYNYTITFNYGTTGSVHGYVGGTPFNNTNILSSIAIAYQGTALRTYYLTYSNTTTATSRYVLTEIQECAGTGTSNCLSPTNVTWQAGAAGVGSGTALSGTVGSVVSTAFDLNGDGLTGDGLNDLVMTTSTGAVLVAFGSSSGYGTPVATGLSAIGGLQIGDIDGSGIAGLMVDVSGTWYYYKWNGSAFVGTSTGISAATAASPVLADLDGDGRADFVYTDSTGIVHVRLSTSTAGTVSFSTSDINTGIGTANFSIRAQIGGSNRALHFWGSAQADLLGTERTCAQYVKNVCVAYQYIYDTLHFTGSTFSTAGLFPTALSSPNPAVDFADYNDDGCTDVLTATHLLLSACDGTAPVPVALPTGVTAVGGMDWNGDGRRDVLVAQSSGYLGVVLSTGTGLASTVTNTSYSTSISYTAAPNLTGDGQDGLIGWNSTSATYYLHNSPGAPPDLLISATDGYGNSASPKYVSIAQSNYTLPGNSPQGYNGAAYPDQSYIGPLYVVSQAVFSDPTNPGGTYNLQFSYYNAWMNLQGRGFEGFQQFYTTDPRTGTTDEKDYRPQFPWTGLLEDETVSPSGGLSYISAVSNSFGEITLDGTANNQRYFRFISGSDTSQSEVGGPENGQAITYLGRTYEYDNYGNVTTTVQTLFDQDASSPYFNETWTSKTVNTISPNTSTWCLNLPSETTVTNSSSAPGGGAITRTVSYPSPDYTLCRQNQQVVEPGNATYQVTTNYLYDTASGNFGNLVKQTVTGIGMTPRVTQYSWTPNGQFLQTVTNPQSELTTLGFDPNSGMLTSVKDANNLTTSWLYDAFARKTTENRPDGTSTTWAYNDCSTAPGCVNSNNRMTIVQLLHPTNAAAHIRTDYTFLDALDRPLVTANQLFDGTLRRTETQYDSLGNVHLQGMPCTFGRCTQYWTTNTYDVLHRLTSSQRPISATNANPQTTTYSYQGRTTTMTDAQSKKTTTISHVTGNVGRVIDHNGYYVNSNLDAFGSTLSTTDSLGNTLTTATYKYGIAPFVVSSTDMDLGNRTYTVDALGEVIGYTDAKGQSFSMQYDLLSRLTNRTEPDLTTTWVWGETPGNYNVGKLQSESSVSSAGTYSETYGYDTVGRLHSQAIQRPVQGTATFYYNYQSYSGFLDSLQYPASTGSKPLQVQYAYPYGVLNSIRDYNAQTNYFWIANTTSPRGQITQETTADLSTGPQIVSTHTYDAVTGWLSANLTGVGGGAALQNESYLYDYVGNVTQRQNNNVGLTEGFWYDNVYRLDHSMLGATKNLQMGYDAMGNITSRSDISGGATWTYDPTHKHQVTQAGSSSFTYTYDANGNAKSRNGTTLLWTSYNYPSYVATSTESANFDYGPDRQRWRMIYDSAAGMETTYYATPLFEEVATSAGTDYRHYIYAGGKPVAVVSRTSAGAISTRSLLTDHQGSISAVITDSTGSSYTKESFTAYGNRRDASTWSGAPISTDRTAMDGVTREGYTFQTVLGAMGLNHMNGRVQDAITGRFLSADPYISGPGNTQSYNRYSYVNNNPLTYTDPTGFLPTICTQEHCPPGDGFAGMPGEKGFCYGGCEGGGYDNSIYTRASSTNPIAAFNNWASAATGSAAQSGYSSTLADTSGFSVGAYALDLQSAPGPLLQYFQSANPMDLTNLVNPDVSYQSQLDHPTLSMLPLFALQGASALDTVASFIMEGAQLTPAGIVAAIAQGHADAGLVGLAPYMTDAQLQLAISGGSTASMFMGTAVHMATAESLSLWYPGQFIYSATAAVDFVFVPTGESIELTTYGGFASHLGRGAQVVCYSLTGC